LDPLEAPVAGLAAVAVAGLLVLLCLFTGAFVAGAEVAGAPDLVPELAGAGAPELAGAVPLDCANTAPAVRITPRIIFFISFSFSFRGVISYITLTIPSCRPSRILTIPSRSHATPPRQAIDGVHSFMKNH
jgi:hypothetical protein